MQRFNIVYSNKNVVTPEFMQIPQDFFAKKMLKIKDFGLIAGSSFFFFANTVGYFPVHGLLNR